MFLSFLQSYPLRNVNAPFLWVFYKQLADLPKGSVIYVLDEHYLKPPQEHEGRSELTREYQDKLEYQVPAQIPVDLTSYLIDKGIWDKLEATTKNRREGYSRLLTEVYDPLYHRFCEIINKHSNEIEAILTWCNCPSLSKVAKEFSLPVIHHELGPLRAPIWKQTAYFDFQGVNGNTSSEKSFLSLSNKEKDFFKVFEPLKELLHPSQQRGIEKQHAKYEIGLAMQVEDDSNVIAYHNGWTLLDLVDTARKNRSKENVLLRPHPSALIGYRDRDTRIDHSPDILSFIEKCQEVWTLNSSVALEAYLLSKPARIFGDSPFSFLQKLAGDERKLALNYLCFGYLIPYKHLFDIEYYRFRLSKPSLKEISNHNHNAYKSTHSDNIKKRSTPKQEIRPSSKPLKISILTSDKINKINPSTNPHVEVIHEENVKALNISHLSSSLVPSEITLLTEASSSINYNDVEKGVLTLLTQKHIDATPISNTTSIIRTTSLAKKQVTSPVNDLYGLTDRDIKPLPIQSMHGLERLSDSSIIKDNFYILSDVSLLLLTACLPMGGACKFNLDLIKGLKQKGYRITVATSLKTTNPWQKAFESAADEVWILPEHVPPQGFHLALDYLIKTRRCGKVLITHSMVGYQSLPWLKQENPKTSFIDYTHIEYETEWPDGGYASQSIEYQDCIDQSIVSSFHLQEWMVDHGRDPQQIEVCTTNIDAKEWKLDIDARNAVRSALNIDPSTCVIFFAGRFAPQKQPTHILKVASVLKNQGITNFLFLVAGSGPDEKLLLNTWQEFQLDDCVKFLGPVPLTDIPSLHSASDIFFLPSMIEGISLAVFEAMACESVPVIAKVGGQDELVTTDTGYTVKYSPNDIHEYVDILKTLISNPSLRTDTAKRAQERVATDFPLQAMINRMDQLIQSTTASPSMKSADLSQLRLAADHNRLVTENQTLYSDLGKATELASQLSGQVDSLKRKLALVKQKSLQST